jgi:hypothetical protein
VIGGLVGFKVMAGMAGRGACAQTHRFSAACVDGRFPWVGCTCCDARLVLDGRRYVLHVPGPYRFARSVVTP